MTSSADAPALAPTRASWRTREAELGERHTERAGEGPVGEANAFVGPLFTAPGVTVGNAGYARPFPNRKPSSL